MAPAAGPRWHGRDLRIESFCVHLCLLVLVSFTAALRRSAPVASRLRGAALGAAAGAWAGLGVFLFCPATDHRHLLVGHVLPIAIFTLLGLAAVPRSPPLTEAGVLVPDGGRDAFAQVGVTD